MDALSSVKNSAMGLFDRTRLYFYDWFANFSFDTKFILTILGFFGAGFAVGLLFRRFAKDLVVLFILFLVLLIVLNHFSIINFNVLKIREITGIRGSDTLDSVFSILVDFVKLYYFYIISLLSGFVVGSKVG